LESLGNPWDALRESIGILRTPIGILRNSIGILKEINRTP